MKQFACRKRGSIAGACMATAGLTLAACAKPPPATPSVMALPAQGESFAVFQQHDMICRQYATVQTGGQTPDQAAAMSSAGGAAMGTGVGAASGALIGSVAGHAGRGAAIGAGGGLIAGGLMGSMMGQQAAASTQSRYDMSYTQCMIANGDRIVPPAAPTAYAAPTVVYAEPPPAVYVPRPVYVAPPVYPPPGIVIVP